jgi:hypothetical protein
VLEKRDEKKKKTLYNCVRRERERVREREKVKKKTLDDCDNRTNWKIFRKRLGTSWP